MFSVHDIDEIINTYKKTVYGTALSHTQNKFDADDVFQEVFLVYFKKNPTFQSEEHRKAWLIRTTLNLCKKVTLSAWRKKTTSLENAPEQSYQFVGKEENTVHSALRELPQKYGAVLYLFYFEEYKTEEIGKILKISTGNVRIRLKRGRDLMREKLKGEYFYE
ncbi:MAG: sigma-70 family RNA polymerase sigma factor [Oscillospiraceae bacterium]|jgi:RNA polymerase sigma-70 factor (ECF subfamily)|nr:sigma-70 family RNA polymerase sigma factor [Oscillospiraceae bacterium]